MTNDHGERSVAPLPTRGQGVRLFDEGTGVPPGIWNALLLPMAADGGHVHVRPTTLVGLDRATRGREQLFDLATDPGAPPNVASGFPGEMPRPAAADRPGMLRCVITGV